MRLFLEEFTEWFSSITTINVTNEVFTIFLARRNLVTH